jgi:nucleoside-diphosphate-sugar epimerase
MKKTLVLGGGGFIGGHLASRLKSDGHKVTIVDLKEHEYFSRKYISDEYIVADLRDEGVVDIVISEGDFDEVYQLGADMGGAGYIFTGDNDANVMHNSAMINLNVAKACADYGVGKVFYSSSACMYPEHNQLDPNNPNCEESSAYPANPDSEYGWEKLFSERLYMAFNRNYGLDIRIARFHNIFGTHGTWKGGKEKSPSAICRKVAEAIDGGEIEIWGDGKQTRSFLDVNVCVEKVLRLMDSDYTLPVNIGSDEMISMNELAKMVIKISGKDLKIKNIDGQDFIDKYGFKCPLGVKGRNSHNLLYTQVVGSDIVEPLEVGMSRLYNWINNII